MILLAVASNLVFATIAIDLAILLVNLLLTSMRHAVPFSACTLKKKHFLWRWYCGKINKLTSAFCASVLLLMINCVITLPKWLWNHKPPTNGFAVNSDNVMAKFTFSNLCRLHKANLSWQTRVGKPKLVCVNGTKTGGKQVCKLLVSNRNVCRLFLCRSHTPSWVCQHEFAN